MITVEHRISELREKYGDRTFFNFQQTQEIIGLGKDAIYELLAEKHLLAHNPRGRTGKNGTRILACSVWDYLRDGVISAEKFSE